MRAPRTTEAGYLWYGAGVGSWFAGFGIQAVLVAHLLTNELGISAEALGLAQTAALLPSLLFLLIGGAVAERRDARRVLVAMHLLAALPAVALAALVYSGALTYWAVIAYAFALGTVNAFAMPARDSELSNVAGANMMRAVTGMTILQFAAQAVGTVGGGAGAASFGSTPVLAVQAVVLLSGALFALRLPPAEPAAPAQAAQSSLREIVDGVREVLGTPELRHPALLVTAVGMFFIGPFLVLYPLLVRDVYGGGAAELGIVNAAFPVGTIAGSLLLRAVHIHRRGRAALLALITGACTLLLVSSGLPFWGLWGATLFWGMAGAVFINCSRSIFQEAAPPSHRARALSIYQLAFIGAAPLGAMLAGLCSGQIGPLATFAVYACSMLVTVALIWSLTTTSQMR